MITQERLKRLFVYKNGNLIRLVRSGNQIAGQIAGTKCKTHGYISIRIDKKVYRAHWLVWLYHYGYLPKEIDHINRNRSDNRIENLRECSRSQNIANKPMQSNNTSGYKGVHWRKGRKKWQVRIKIDGKQRSLGHFDCIKDAIKTSKEARTGWYGNFWSEN